MRKFLLFLDDIRVPAGGEDENGDPYDMIFICRCALDAERIFALHDSFGVQWHISFDFDLGQTSEYFDALKPENFRNDGKWFADWLITRDIAYKGTIFKRLTYYVHSQNPVGRDAIYNVMEDYIKFQGNQND